ncbi:MAG: hypothetical protein V1900_03940 [Candidatus Aenigmatarchaeota archaeon]
MLTFEKIRDFERAERSEGKMQKLPDNLIEELNDYLRKKEAVKEKSSREMIEMENVKNTIKRLFEIRERKLMDSLLYTARTALPPENLMKSEEHLFYFMLEELKKFREKTFLELKKEETNEKRIFYRVKKSIPAFVGPDLKVYNLKENDNLDIDSIPKQVNDLLLEQGVLEMIEE